MGFTTIEWAVGAVMVFMALISTICSMLTIYLISVQEKMSGYLLLVLSLTISQMIYDFSFFFNVAYSIPSMYRISVFLSTFGGIATSLWSNCISVVISWVVIYCKSFPVFEYFYIICTIIIVPSLALAIANEVYFETDKEIYCNFVYYYWRLLAIAFNLVAYVAISMKLRAMFKDKSEEYRKSPLRALVRRFKYYPLCQALIRSGAAWYEFAYGFSTSGFSSQSSTLETVSLFLFVFCSSAAGIAYFCIFLIMQPKAWKHFQQLRRGKLRNQESTTDNSDAKGGTHPSNSQEDMEYNTQSRTKDALKTSNVLSSKKNEMPAASKNNMIISPLVLSEESTFEKPHNGDNNDGDFFVSVVDIRPSDSTGCSASFISDDGAYRSSKFSAIHTNYSASFLSDDGSTRGSHLAQSSNSNSFSNNLDQRRFGPSLELNRTSKRQSDPYEIEEVEDENEEFGSQWMNESMADEALDREIDGLYLENIQRSKSKEVQLSMEGSRY